MAECNATNLSRSHRVVKALIILILIGVLRGGLKVAWHHLQIQSRTVVSKDLVSKQRWGYPALQRNMGR